MPEDVVLIKKWFGDQVHVTSLAGDVWLKRLNSTSGVSSTHGSPKESEKKNDNN